MEPREISTAQALRRAHEALRTDLQALEASLARDSAENLAPIRIRLKATQTHLLEHFRFEEQNGYMEKVRNGEPRLEHAIDQLAAEHRQLAGDLKSILESTNDTSCLESVGHRIREWIAAMRQHEACEDRLVQEAFNFDVGEED